MASTLPGTYPFTLKCNRLETAHHILEKWCKKQSPGFTYKPNDLWLVCGSEVLENNLFCKDIISQSHFLCSQVHMETELQDLIYLLVMTYDEVKSHLDLRRRKLEMELRGVEEERVKRCLLSGEIPIRPPAIDSLIEPTTEPRSLQEPCNGAHALINAEYPGVKIILTRRGTPTTPSIFFRPVSQEVEQLLSTWKHLYPDPDTKDQKLVVVLNGSALHSLATWWWIGGVKHRYTNDREKAQAKPLYVEIMTEELFQRLAAEKKAQTTTLAEGPPASGRRSTSALGKRQRRT